MEVWCYLRQSLQRGRDGGEQKGFLGFRATLCYSNVSSADARVYNEEVLCLCAVSPNVPDLGCEAEVVAAVGGSSGGGNLIFVHSE